MTYLDVFVVTRVDQEGADHLCFHVSARCHDCYKKNQPPHELCVTLL